MANRFFNPNFQALDSNGDPLSGAKLYFYQSGTTTALDTYSDTDLTTANANPVVADSAGRFGDIFLQAQDYNVVLKTSADVTVWSADPVSGSVEGSGDYFKPTESSPQAMTIDLGAGVIFDQTTRALTVVAAQTSALMVAPTTNPRRDIVYVDILTGVDGTETGAEAASPSDPVLTAGKLPVARVNLTVGMTEITTSNIDDIRELGNLGMPTFIDEDDMASDSATRVPSQQSVKAYVDLLSPLRGYIDGLILSNDATDPQKDIGISAGIARDGGDAVNMVLSSALIKKLDASWAVGTNQGALDGTESVAGTPDANTWYHIWLIRRSDTGVVDVLASESATAPTMPTNYDQKRRIGAVLFDATPDILAFTQVGDIFRWKTPIKSVDTTTLSTSRVESVIAVPAGLQIPALIRAQMVDTATQAIIITDGDGADVTPGTAYGAAHTVTGLEGAVNTIEVLTDTSAQIGARSTAASTSLAIFVIGWRDPRGRNL